VRKKATAFIPGWPFQPRLMFVSKDGPYPSEAPFSQVCTPGADVIKTFFVRAKLERYLV
jgi:hypothetical protein